MENGWKKEQADLMAFWDRCFSPEEGPSADGISGTAEELAPSRKLHDAVRALGGLGSVLDYGCGGGWGAVTAALAGCAGVTAADTSENAVRTAARTAELYGVKDRIRFLAVGEDWLSGQPSGAFDGFLCSNVLDVVPPEVSDSILENAARLLTENGAAVIGMNYYLSPEQAKERGLDLRADRKLFVDGILRMVSRTDGEWTEILSRHFTVEKLDHFAWPNEKAERRRLFLLRKK